MTTPPKPEPLLPCPTPPSDGAAAVSDSPDFRSKAPLGDAAHGDTAVVAALPEGVMSAQEFILDIFDYVKSTGRFSPLGFDACEFISRLETRDAQLSQAKGGQPEWYIDEDNEGREDWTDVLCDAHTLRPYSVRGAIEVTQQYAVLFPSRNDEDDDSQKLFETLEDAEKAIEEYKIAASVTVTTEFPVRAGADASLTAPQAPGEGE